MLYPIVFHTPAFGQPLTHPADYLEHPDYWAKPEPDETQPMDDLVAELADQQADYDDLLNFSGALYK